ncbi:DNA processing protein DprA [Spirochaetia bacterium]|nr:DNA processing protein DprA [Spirochaetia bacterium]
MAKDRGLLDLIITRIPGLTALERGVLCRKFEGEAEITLLSKRDIELILDRPMPRLWDMDTVRIQAEKDARGAQIRGIRWVSLVSPEYPPLLREIYDPPAVLFCRGSLPDPEQPLAAVVGTRRPSPAASAQAFEIGRFLGAQNIPVVSGLALGIDAMAHRGNLEGGAPTIAVLGSGPDEVYPASNRALARRILENGGAILSEYPPGTSPRKWQFPARNRIISALARGTLIVEAPAKSGALITAQFALEQGRDLWVASSGAAVGAGNAGTFGTVRGGLSAYGEGTRKLAADGARIIYSGSDILDEWGIRTPQILNPKEKNVWP